MRWCDGFFLKAVRLAPDCETENDRYAIDRLCYDLRRNKPLGASRAHLGKAKNSYSLYSSGQGDSYSLYSSGQGVGERGFTYEEVPFLRSDIFRL